MPLPLLAQHDFLRTFLTTEVLVSLKWTQVVNPWDLTWPYGHTYYMPTSHVVGQQRQATKEGVYYLFNKLLNRNAYLYQRTDHALLLHYTIVAPC